MGNRKAPGTEVHTFCPAVSVGFDLTGQSCVRLVLVAGCSASQPWMGLQTWVSSGLGLVADVYRVPSCARPRDEQELGSSKLNKATVAPRS